MPKIIGFDTETVETNTKKGLAQAFYSAQFFCPELKINRYITDRNELEAFFNRKSESSILLANNAEFDFSVLAKVLDKRRFTLRCLYNKSRFIYGKVIYKKHCWKIYDLSNIFVFWSLAKIGHFVGLEKLEKPIYLGKREPETTVEKAYFCSYAMRDAEIGYLAGKWLYNRFGKICVTLPSLAFYYFNAKYQPKGLYLTKNEKNDNKLRLSYKGGRVESLIRGTPERKIYVYDKVSLYPYVMQKYRYPCGINGLTETKNMDLRNEGIASVTVNQTCELPFLATKHICPDGYVKLVFPNGIFKTWVTYPELRYFVKNRLGKILTVHECLETYGKVRYFKDYVKEFYELKNTDVEHKDFWKLCLNSLYGKFAQDVYGGELEITEDCKIKKLKVNEFKTQIVKRNILVSAYIAGYGRIEMYDDFKQVGIEDLVYTDTDSIHSFKKLVNIGENIGDLAYKTEGYATYIRSKFYIFNGEVCCRGMPKKVDAVVLRELIKRNQVDVISLIMLRLRSAFRQKCEFLTSKQQLKHFSIETDHKRIYEKDLRLGALLTDYSTSQAVCINEGLP